MKILRVILKTGLTLFILAWFLPTVSYLNWTTLIFASLVLTILQQIVRPILKILFLPISIVTFGLFSVVLNVALLWLATYLVPGLRIENITLLGIELNQFFSLLLVSSLLGFLQSFLGFIL